MLYNNFSCCIIIYTLLNWFQIQSRRSANDNFRIFLYTQITCRKKEVQITISMQVYTYSEISKLPLLYKYCIQCFFITH